MGEGEEEKEELAMFTIKRKNERRVPGKRHTKKSRAKINRGGKTKGKRQKGPHERGEGKEKKKKTSEVF